jgi:type IV secretory pathway VirB6-like protein
MDTSCCSIMKKLHWVDRFLIVFLVIWTLFTILEDSLAVWDLYRQCKSTSYPDIQGVITRNETLCHDYDLYEVEIEYTYHVDGKKYTGNRYIYDAMIFGKATSGPQRKAKNLERFLPLGLQVIIYYNPSNPAESVLKTGIIRYHLFVLVVLAFFNIIMIVGWLMLAASFLGSNEDSPGSKEYDTG